MAIAEARRAVRLAIKPAELLSRLVLTLIHQQDSIFSHLQDLRIKEAQLAIGLMRTKQNMKEDEELQQVKQRHASSCRASCNLPILL